MEAETLFNDGDCTITLNGKSFTNGGAFIATCSDSKMRGVVYAHSALNMVTNWHGDIKIPARFSRSWVSNMGDRRRSVRFVFKGKHFYGVWCSCNWTQIVRVREVKPN